MSGAAARRILHAGTAAVLLLQPLVSHAALRLVVVTLAAIALSVDVWRLRSPAVQAALQRRLPVFRSAEQRRVSGGAWLWVGYALAVWLPPTPAAAGVLVAALADPAASVVGTRVGTPGRKTWQGSVAALVVALALLLGLGIAPPAALAAAFLGAVVERWPGPLDDNLLLPVLVGLVVWGLT